MVPLCGLNLPKSCQIRANPAFCFSKAGQALLSTRAFDSVCRPFWPSFFDPFFRSVFWSVFEPFCLPFAVPSLPKILPINRFSGPFSPLRFLYRFSSEMSTRRRFSGPSDPPKSCFFQKFLLYMSHRSLSKEKSVRGRCRSRFWNKKPPKILPKMVQNGGRYLFFGYRFSFFFWGPFLEHLESKK